MEKTIPDFRAEYGQNNMNELPLRHYEELFLAADLLEISERTGLPYRVGEITIPYFTDQVTVSRTESEVLWRNCSENGLKEKEKILLLRFMLEGRKTAKTAVFRAYNELPWGDVYDRQFRGRCISRLVGTFGTRIPEFKAACIKSGGMKVTGSGLIYEIPFMPELFLRVIIWEGDDEFPASGQILFSENFGEAVSAEDRVIIAELLLSRMTK